MQTQVDAVILTKPAEFLRNYNHWRRGADIEMPAPKEIGEAIQTICDAILGPEKITTCPFCGSIETDVEWQEASHLPEYQHGECFTCEEHWNECARDEFTA